jgi:hypothetical protein
VATNASAEPTKTDSLDWPELAKENVASCVLSPSSAMKTAAKVAPVSFQSIVILPRAGL